MDMNESPVLFSRKSHQTPMKWKSPINHHESPRSSLLFSAQAKSYEKKLKSVRKIKNPFEPQDPMILEEHVCSPDILKVCPQPEEFSWSIEDISRIKPASFDSPKSVASEEFDEVRESKVQEAIDKYFTSTHDILSPDDAYTGMWRCPANSYPSSNASSTAIKKPRAAKTDVGVQTMYSFPPVLPPEIEELLKPYVCDIEVQSNTSIDNEDNILNTSTFRRKLLFNNEEEDLSPVKLNGRQFTPSPPKTDISSRSSWIAKVRKPFDDAGSIPSSPDLSPIKIRSDMSIGSNMSVDDVSMMAVDASMRHDDMTVSMDHNRIFSSTVMPANHSGVTGTESGYGTSSGSYPSRITDF